MRNAYGVIPGTLPLASIVGEGERSSPPTPDLMVSFDWDENAIAGGNAAVPGTEYASAQRYRGMHGSFSPRDVHNTLIARGPHFKVGFADTAPSGNVDIPATVARLLGLSFAVPNGRVLAEAFVGQSNDVSVETVNQTSGPVALKKTCNPDDPCCARSAGSASYSVTLSKKVLTEAATKRTFTYFERAAVAR